MKKATVGMVMLVSLVFIKAYISKDQSSLSIEEGRAHSVSEYIIESKTLRADHFSYGSSQLTLVAQNFNHPELQIPENNIVNQESPISNIESNTNDYNADIVETTEEEIEDVVPMDYISNTGYGLLKTTTEKIISKNERVGKEPLDSGNTISDNISKMFPRSL